MENRDYVEYLAKLVDLIFLNPDRESLNRSIEYIKDNPDRLYDLDSYKKEFGKYIRDNNSSYREIEPKEGYFNGNVTFVDEIFLDDEKGPRAKLITRDKKSEIKYEISGRNFLHVLHTLCLYRLKSITRFEKTIWVNVSEMTDLVSPTDIMSEGFSEIFFPSGKINPLYPFPKSSDELLRVAFYMSYPTVSNVESV
jgi:hypothetical protein